MQRESNKQTNGQTEIPVPLSHLLLIGGKIINGQTETNKHTENTNTFASRAPAQW